MRFRSETLGGGSSSPMKADFEDFGPENLHEVLLQAP